MHVVCRCAHSINHFQTHSNTDSVIQENVDEMKARQDEMKASQDEMKASQDEMKASQDEMKATISAMERNQSQIKVSRFAGDTKIL